MKYEYYVPEAAKANADRYITQKLSEGPLWTLVVAKGAGQVRAKTHDNAINATVWRHHSPIFLPENYPTKTPDTKK